MNICLPMRKNIIKKCESSWITQDIKNYKTLIFDIIELHKLSPESDILNEIILDMKFKYDIMINNSKLNYYNEVIISSKNACKTMWNVVNRERGKDNSPKLDFTDVIIKPDGNKFDSKKEIVDAMNSRFLGAAAACGAPPADVTGALAVLRAARPPADRVLRFRAFTAHEVYVLLTSRIPPKASKDVYGISMKVLRQAAGPLAPVLANLYNGCIKKGVYPDPLKMAKVAPIFKGKGKKTDIDSYRPVSIIPALAKVLENGISTRLSKFLADTDALSDRQHAYRERRSTTSLTRDLIRRILAAREDKQQVGLLCCDLSKAFDVADHTILAEKLKHYGIEGASYSLLRDLLINRAQVVVGSGGKAISDSLSSKMGVAQGSSVSNIMFSLLLNDLPEAVTTAELLMYADDVAAVVTGGSIDLLEQRMNETATQLSGWFRLNGLALNLKKTHFLHFCLSGRRTRPLSVVVDGEPIVQKAATTFLGFEVDACLKWENHIDRLCSKIGSACFALKRVARVVSTEVARTCYFATVHSLLQYGAELWGRAAEWERVFRMQKRAVRAIVGVPQDVSARPYFKSLGILTLPALVIVQVAVYVRVNIDSYIQHDHTHRRAGKLAALGRTLQKSSKLTHIMGPAVYNKLPSDVTAAETTTCFKSRLQRWLIEQTIYSFDEFLKLKL